MRPVIIGTAGHIDHGKSSLIRALTGTDPDRLAEEKERGMTIDIGFAFLNQDIAFIDVPGHEKFIKNMVTGASTIDTALLVVAADDGIMPQTREHFDILKLLDVRHGLIVITKIDLAEADWVDLVEEDIREMVRGSFLDKAAIFRVSAANGRGVEALKKYLLALPLENRRDAVSTEFFRLPVDRVFSVKGYGTVVTGTIVSGTVKVGDTLELMPSKKTVKVRGIQSHNVAVNTLSAGHRAAINVQGVESGAIERGHFLVTPEAFTPGKILSVFVSLLSVGKTLKYNSPVRVHLGTGEYLARIRLIGRDVLSPNESGIAQLIFQQDVCAGFRDRFILRRYSPMRTIGGGVVLDVTARPLRKRDTAAAEFLKSRLSDSGADLIYKHIENSNRQLVHETELSRNFSMPVPEVRRYLKSLTEEKRIVAVNKYWIASGVYDNLQNDCCEYLQSYHRDNPISPGISKAALQNRLKIAPDLLDILLIDLAAVGRVKIKGDRVSLPEFQVRLTAEQQEFIETVERELRVAGFSPPALKEIFQKSRLPENEVQQLLSCLLDEGRIVQIDRDKFVHADIIRNGERQIRKFLSERKSATVSELKGLLNTSRKWAIPLLNYYDKSGLTTRVGDLRELHQSD